MASTFTKDEAAALLGISPSTLQSQVAKDRIKAYDLRPEMRFTQREITEYRKRSQPDKPELTTLDFYNARNAATPAATTDFGGMATAAAVTEDSRALSDAAEEAAEGEDEPSGQGFAEVGEAA